MQNSQDRHFEHQYLFPRMNGNLQPVRILVTGGAGFIGSNIVEALLQSRDVSTVRVLDNFATGHEKNIEGFFSNSKFEFIEGDIRDFATCQAACKDIQLISHQAALGSVPRSINDPITTNEVNITGTLNVFTAAKEEKIQRVVFAASSSTYGDSTVFPRQEDHIGNPISPYAVTKLVNELYAGVFSRMYNMRYIGLRYFNIFGPRQDPDGAYAAVIPLFMKALLENVAPVINGDGSHSRDFTYVGNAVQANIKALFSNRPDSLDKIYNIATGKKTTLLELFQILKELTGVSVKPVFGAERMGDVKHSMADITKAVNYLNYRPSVNIREGLEKALDWYQEQFYQEPVLLQEV